MTSRAILPEPLNAAPLRGGVPLHAFVRLRCLDYVQKNIKNGPPGASKSPPGFSFLLPRILRTKLAGHGFALIPDKAESASVMRQCPQAHTADGQFRAIRRDQAHIPHCETQYVHATKRFFHCLRRK